MAEYLKLLINIGCGQVQSDTSYLPSSPTGQKRNQRKKAMFVLHKYLK